MPKPPEVISERGFIVMVVLRLPHLVLAHVGDDQRSSLGLAPQIVYHMRGVEMATVRQILNIAHRRVTLQVADVVIPFAAIGRVRSRKQIFEHLAQIADQCNVNADILIDFRGIDFDVNLLRFRRVVLQISGDAIIEAHAEGEQQIRFLDRRVYPRLRRACPSSQDSADAMPESHRSREGHRNRHMRFFREPFHQLGRARKNDPVSSKDDWPLRFVDQRKRLVIVGGVRKMIRAIGGQLRRRGFPVELASALLRIFSDVDQHRSRPSRLCDINASRIVRAISSRRRNEIVMLVIGSVTPVMSVSGTRLSQSACCPPGP